MLPAVERLTLENVRVLDPASGLDALHDVVIAGGRIERLAAPRSERSPGRVNADGCWLLPSLSDLRCRLGEPGFEYKETIQSGLAAAAAGGFARVCVLPDGRPSTDDAVVVDALLRGADAAKKCELIPIGAATKRLAGTELAEFGALSEAGVVAVSNADDYVSSPALMLRVFEYALTFDLLVMQQPTEPSLAQDSVVHEGAVSARLGLRGCPAAAEQIGIERDLALVRKTGARYHASCLSTQEAVAAVARAKADGLPVSADVCFAQLFFTDQDVGAYDPAYRTFPPLRGEAHRAALLEAVQSGVIDAISSNHTPQSALEKRCEFDQAAPGMIGFELCLSALLELHLRGDLELKRLIQSTALEPARILRCPAPSLREGSLASCVLVDPRARWKPSETPLRSKSRNTPFFDRELHGKVLLTLHRGAAIHAADSLASASNGHS